MKELTANEVKEVSGAKTLGEMWSFGPTSYVLGTYIGIVTGNPIAGGVAGAIFSVYDNVDWNKRGEEFKQEYRNNPDTFLDRYAEP